MSIQSYRPDTFDDNSVRAFEWLADLVARVLTKEAEDRDALRRRPAGVDDTPSLITADHIVELLSSRVAGVRQLAQDALVTPDAGSMCERIVAGCRQLQPDLVDAAHSHHNGQRRSGRSDSGYHKTPGQ
jgi:hypothetical protein